MSVDPSIAMMMDQYQAEFQATKHPLVVWYAYHLWRSAQRRGATEQIPEWILAEFDGIVDRISQEWQAELGERPSTKDHWTRRIARVFGFHTPSGGGQADPIKSWVRVNDDFELAARVRVMVDDGVGPTNACYLVEQLTGTSEPEVARAWKRCEAAVRKVDLRIQRLQLAIVDRQMKEFEEQRKKQ